MEKINYNCTNCDHVWQGEPDGIHFFNRDGTPNPRVFQNYKWTCPVCHLTNVLEENRFSVLDRIQINSHITDEDKRMMKNRGKVFDIPTSWWQHLKSDIKPYLPIWLRKKISLKRQTTSLFCSIHRTR